MHGKKIPTPMTSTRSVKSAVKKPAARLTMKSVSKSAVQNPAAKPAMKPTISSRSAVPAAKKPTTSSRFAVRKPTTQPMERHVQFTEESIEEIDMVDVED